MKAPEKIYIPTAGEELHYHMACPRNEFKESIEYIRKDVFIEKLAEWLKNHHHEYSDWNVDDCELQFKTEEIIEDLKNYIHLL